MPSEVSTAVVGGMQKLLLWVAAVGGLSLAARYFAKRLLKPRKDRQPRKRKYPTLVDVAVDGEADRSSRRANTQQTQSRSALLELSDVSSTDPQMPPEVRKEPVAVPPKRAQYMDKFRLLNKSEQELLQRLEEAMPAMRVFSQVSMSQLFHIGYRKDAFRQLGEIGRKSVDFLVCRRTDTSIVVAIELNGPTHEQEKQRISDEKKRAALEEAGIPLLVFYPDNLPDVATLRAAIAPFIIQRKQYEAERDERLGITGNK